MCITKNRFRYWAFWREANATLKDLLIPSIKEIPKFVYNSKIPDYSDIKESLNNEKINLSDKKFEYFELWKLFDLKRWNSKIKTNEIEDFIWNINFVSAITKNNWVFVKVSLEPNFLWNSITVANSWEGSVWFSFYHEKSFYAASTVNILYPKFNLNSFIWVYLSVILKRKDIDFLFEDDGDLKNEKFKK